MIICGVDCSSTTIGISFLEIEGNNIKLIKSDYIKPIKKGSITERLADTRTKIKKIIEENKPDEICIEDIIQFLGGGSTAKTIITLTSFNRMVCLLAYDYLGKSPELFSVMTIRHGIKLDKVFPKKEQIPQVLEARLKFKFPWEYNKKGKEKIENFDKADSIAVALYYALKITGQLKKKSKLK